MLFNAFFSNALGATRCSVDLRQAQDQVGGSNWGAFVLSRISGAIEMPGISGTFSSITDLRTGRYYDHQKYGPVDASQGYDGKVRWIQDTPGDVRDEDNLAVRADTVSERFDRSLAYWFPKRMSGTTRCEREIEEQGIPYAVYAISPKHGLPFELWINTQTRRIERKVQRRGAVESITRYADFRPVDGVQAPFLIENESSDTHVMTRLQIEQRHFESKRDEASFAKPLLHLDDYTFPQNKNEVTLPFDSTGNDVYVPVKLNGHGPYNMILDTGGDTVVSPQLTQTLDIRAEGALGVTGFGDGAAALNLTRFDRVEIAGVTLRNHPGYVIDLDSPSENVPLLGIVGYGVFKRLVIRIDNEHKTLTLSDPKTFHYRGNGAVIPFTFRDSHPYIKASLEGVEGQWLVDTGFAGQLGINAPFAEAHGFRTRYPSFDAAIIGWGVGGAMHGQMARGHELRIGHLIITEPLIRMARNQLGASADPYTAGSIGIQLLSRYNVIFDYSRQQIIFEPRANKVIENDYDRSGMRIHRHPNGLIVADVVSGGPAEQAGIRPGDLLLQIADRVMRDWSLASLRDFLRIQAAGTQIPVEIARDDKKLQFVISLRNLIPPPQGAP